MKEIQTWWHAQSKADRARHVIILLMVMAYLASTLALRLPDGTLYIVAIAKTLLFILSFGTL